MLAYMHHTLFSFTTPSCQASGPSIFPSPNPCLTTTLVLTQQMTITVTLLLTLLMSVPGRITAKSVLLKAGSRFVTVTHPLKSEHWEIIKVLKLRMSWSAGHADSAGSYVFIHQRRGAEPGSLANPASPARSEDL